MRILVLAGGCDQCALIKELQNRNHEVILLDYLPNPPAKGLVEHHIQESTLDFDKVRETALKYSVDLICTACTDQALLSVAKVSEELGLPSYLTYNQALDVTNKSFMKKKMIEANIPTSLFHVISDVSELETCKYLKYPLVIKPADCNSSKGVIKVTTEEECKVALESALNLSRSHTAIVEEFKEGSEISADFYINEGKAIYLSCSYSTKIPNTHGFTINGSYYYPTLVEDIDKLTSVAQNVAEAFNLKETPLLIQLIKNRNEYSVIEFSARMGGGSKYRLIQEISGIDIMHEYVNLILGKKTKISVKNSNKHIKVLYVYANSGNINKISGLEELKKTNVILEYFIYKSLGDHIEKTETSSDRVLGFIVSADNTYDLTEKINQANNSISIIDESGNDIMRHELIK